MLSDTYYKVGNLAKLCFSQKVLDLYPGSDNILIIVCPLYPPKLTRRSILTKSVNEYQCLQLINLRQIDVQEKFNSSSLKPFSQTYNLMEGWGREFVGPLPKIFVMR